MHECLLLGGCSDSTCSNSSHPAVGLLPQFVTGPGSVALTPHTRCPLPRLALPCPTLCGLMRAARWCRPRHGPRCALCIPAPLHTLGFACVLYLTRSTAQHVHPDTDTARGIRTCAASGAAALRGGRACTVQFRAALDVCWPVVIPTLSLSHPSVTRLSVVSHHCQYLIDSHSFSNIPRPPASPTAIRTSYTK